MHYVIVPALCCAAATSEVKEIAIPDPQLTQFCNEFVDVFDEPGMPPDRDVTHDIVLDEGKTPPKPSIYCTSPAELEEIQR